MNNELNDRQLNTPLPHLLDAIARLYAATGRVLAAPLNEEFSAITHATFTVVPEANIEFSPEGLRDYCSHGNIFMYPENANTYAFLNAYKMPDGGIDLMALRWDIQFRTLPYCENLDAFDCLLDDIFYTFIDDGLIPLDNLVSSVLKSFGYNKNSKKRIWKQATNVVRKPDVVHTSEKFNAIVEMMIQKLDSI